MALNTKNKFEYGYTFELKLIALLIKDQTFAKKMVGQLKPEYFDSEANNWLVNTILEYYITYDKSPTLDVFKVKIDAIDKDALKSSVISNLREITTKYSFSTDLNFVKDETIKFCVSKNLSTAILDAPDYIESGDFDGLKEKINEATKISYDDDLGHGYLEGFEERYEEPPRNTIETPWPVINEIMDGGLGGGELGILVANPGVGKSWALVNIAAHAITLGKKVIYYTLELKDRYVSRRFDSFYSRIAPHNLLYHKDDIKSKLPKSETEVMKTKYYASNSVTINSLENHVDRCIFFGFVPGLIIIDYPDLLKNVVVHKREDLNLNNIYTMCRGLAGKYDVPIWIASQARRSSAEKDIVTGEEIAEAYSKLFVGDFVASLSRKVTDKVAGTGRWHIIKNRFGPDGQTYPSKINLAIGTIEIHDDTSISGIETNKKMSDESEILKSFLNKKKEKGELDLE
jgi:hypothetical protein